MPILVNGKEFFAKGFSLFYFLVTPAKTRTVPEGLAAGCRKSMWKATRKNCFHSLRQDGKLRLRYSYTQFPNLQRAFASLTLRFFTKSRARVSMVN